MSDNIPQQSDYLCYEVAEANLFFSSGDPVSIPQGEIEKFLVANMYSTNNLPAFTFSFKVNNRTYLRMMSDKTELTLHLKIDYYIKNHGNEQKGLKRTWFNKKFDVYIEDDTPNLIRETMNSVDDVTKSTMNPQTTEENSNARDIVVSVTLFDKDAVNTAYSVGGGVFASGNMETVVTHQLSAAKASSVLMQPMDNKGSFPQIIVPPFTLVGRLNYLNAVYGFYKNGMMLFFGLDRTYLIGKDSKAKAFVQHEVTDIILMVRKEKDERRLDDGSRLEVEQRTVYINVTDDDLTFTSNSLFNNMLHGSNISEVVTQTNSFRNLTAKNRRKGNTQKKYYHNKYNNPYALTEYVSELSRDDRLITVTLRDVNLHWFLPNKKFKLTFLDSQQGKEYNTEVMLMNTQLVFAKHDDHFRLTLLAAFKQVK